MKEISLISPDYQGQVDYTRHACRGIIVKDNKILLSYLFPCKINDSYVLTFAFSISLNQLQINIGTYYLQTLGRKRPNFRIRMKS